MGRSLASLISDNHFHVESVEQSSTTMASQSTKLWPRTLLTASLSRGSRLRVGITMVTEGPVAWANPAFRCSTPLFSSGCEGEDRRSSRVLRRAPESLDLETGICTLITSLDQPQTGGTPQTISSPLKPPT